MSLRRLAFYSAIIGAGLLGCGRSAPQPARGTASAGTGPTTPQRAAQELIATLADSSRSLALFPFHSPERTNWDYVPEPRAGLPVKKMLPQERKATEALLRTGLGDHGARLAADIMEHEVTLRALEIAAGDPRAPTRRDPGLYYLTIFGTPAPDSAWGWRFEGHHLSVNATIVGRNEQVVAPLFMGANPARVPSGPKAGLRLLADEEDLARELVTMFDSTQLARAIISEKTFGDIVTRNDPAVRPLAFEGLPAAEMTPAQQQQLRRLLSVYLRRMHPAAARSQMERIEAAGFDRLHFAWAGSIRAGEPHYYRIHGPTVLVEYDNTQNNANHIHTVWRDLENDFGGDLLRQHYARHHHH
ncbi:MAG TPA: DUF3500 domain-containing protein [Longimicrobiales bacterium]